MSQAIPETTTKPAPGVDDVNRGPSSSIFLEYALLQLRQAETSKTEAAKIMDQIKKNQALQKKTADFISQARAAQNKAQAENKKDGTTEMPADMRQFFKENNLVIDQTATGGDNAKFTPDQWDVNIKSLNNFMDTLGSSTQTQMVLAQDYIGQFNSFMQGANKAITDSNNLLTAIVR